MSSTLVDMPRIIIDENIRRLRIGMAELYDFRWVLAMLVLRDIKLRYKQTYLGIAWVVLQPLATAGLFTLVFGHFLHLPSEGVPYELFTLCGLIPWMVFSQSLQRGSTSLINDSRLITKVYFPRIFIPLSATFGVAVDFVITVVLLVACSFIYPVPLTAKIGFLPVGALVLFTFSSGMNLLLSAVNVYFRDFKHVVPFLLQFWMYASPLVYSTSLVLDSIRFLYLLNPMAGLIDFFRWSLLGLESFPLVSFSLACITSFLLLIFGTIIFRKMEVNFADMI